MTDNGIKLCSLNCQGLGDENKRRDVFNFLRNHGYSIICLQDTHFSKSRERIIESEWGYKAVFNSFDSRSRGVAILFKNNFEFKIHHTCKDDSGNFLLVELEINEKRFLIINIYGPNKDDPAFYEYVMSKVLLFSNTNIIIVGDWNLLLNPEIDGLNYKHINNPKARLQVLKIMNDLNLFDVWREENLDKKIFTWKRKIEQGLIQMGRLDFFLVSEGIINYIKGESIRPGYRSDHSIIEIRLVFVENEVKSKTYWKFNNSLLYNFDFVKEVKESILKIKQQYAALAYNFDNINSIDNEMFETVINKQLFLEMLLLEIRNTTISFSSALKKKEREKEKDLEHAISIMEKESQEDNYDRIIELKEELQEIRGKRMRGMLIRSRARWIEDGEKASKYFCNLENRNFVSKRMTSVINDKGDEITEGEQIRAEVFDFYKLLYSSKEHIIENVDLDILLDENTPKLTDLEAFSLEGEISLNEASVFLKKMSNNKSPGSTGFTTEFYKFFWKDLGIFVVNSINFGFLKGELSPTQKEGIITCIPKGNKSKKYIKNWRPISLLNVSYKIASGCIAARIKKVLPSIIDLDQSGFMSGRFTGDNIRLIYDLLNYSNIQKRKGILLLIDFEKAFDSVAWSFMEKCLSFYNFKDDIKSWIKTFYMNIKSTVIVNNKPTPWFSIERGCRQGDPISPYIFLLCGEILAHMIRQNDEIRGYFVFNKEIKISQYADDTSLFLDGSKESFEMCIHTVLEYAKYSGLAMNFQKTKVIWIGCQPDPNEVFLPHMNFEWNPIKFNILGIDFTRDLKDISDKNIESKLYEMQREINSWSKRDLTPFGRVVVIRTLVISKIVHILISLPTPSKRMMLKINNMLFDFLWDGKPDKIKRCIAKQKLDNGGINMIDIDLFDKALKLTWIRRFISGNQKWKNLIIEINPNFEYFFLFGNIFIKRLAYVVDNPFWTHVMTYLGDFMYKCKIVSFEDFCATSFLYNSNYKIGGNVIENCALRNHGVYFIYQLMNNDDNFYSLDEFNIKYNLNLDFLTYHSIIRCIKTNSTLDDLEKTNKKLHYQPAINVILKDKKGATNIYQNLLTNSVEIKGKNKWCQLTGISEEDWFGSFALLKRTTCDTKLRWLQFRILHHILTTNRSASKFKPDQSDLCTFCKIESETIQHLIWHCEIVKSFYNNFIELINRRCKHSHNMTINQQLVFFGCSEYIYTDRVFDTILLLLKSYVYRCKVQDKELNKRVFIKELFNRYCIEKCLRKNSKQFQSDWEAYADLFKCLM